MVQAVARGGRLSCATGQGLSWVGRYGNTASGGASAKEQRCRINVVDISHKTCPLPVPLQLCAQRGQAPRLDLHQHIAPYDVDLASFAFEAGGKPIDGRADGVEP